MINLKPLTSTLAASTVITVMGAFDVANAATFNFSFSNEDGAVPGTVEGTIELPDGYGIFAASNLTVTSAPVALGFTLPTMSDECPRYIFRAKYSPKLAGAFIRPIN